MSVLFCFVFTGLTTIEKAVVLIVKLTDYEVIRTSAVPIFQHASTLMIEKNSI